MITRLDYATAVKQFVFVAVSVTVSLVVPVIIRRLKFLSKWTNFYAGVGIAALLFVAVLAQTSYGAKLGFSIGGISIQPSEFVKILFVFYVASSLRISTDFKNVVKTTIVAALHVLILVASTDLGAALIMFVVYLVMLYVATRQPLYVLAGLGGGSDGICPCLSFVWTCQNPCGSMGIIVCNVCRRRISGGAVSVCNRNRRMVRNGTLSGNAG